MERLRYALPRLIPPALLAMVLASVLAHPGRAVAATPHFPRPKCGWASAAHVSRAIADPVSAAAPSWSVQSAPILTCRYVERHARAQYRGEPIVEIQYLENQRFSTRGLTPVAHLGSCDPHAQCPAPHQPAWRLVEGGGDTTNGFSMSSPRFVQYRVQDDLNAIVLTISNPVASLSVSNESAVAEKLVRGLLGRFRWRG